MRSWEGREKQSLKKLRFGATALALQYRGQVILRADTILIVAEAFAQMQEKPTLAVLADRELCINTQLQSWAFRE